MAEVPKGGPGPQGRQKELPGEALCSQLWGSAWQALRAEAGEPASWLSCLLQRPFANVEDPLLKDCVAMMPGVHARGAE